MQCNAYSINLKLIVLYDPSRFLCWFVVYSSITKQKEDNKLLREVLLHIPFQKVN